MQRITLNAPCDHLAFLLDLSQLQSDLEDDPPWFSAPLSAEVSERAGMKSAVFLYDDVGGTSVATDGVHIIPVDLDEINASWALGLLTGLQLKTKIN